MRLLQSPISITDTHTLIRSLQCAAQWHAAARSVNTRPDSSGSIPVTLFFVGTVVYCRYCWYVKLWCLFWSPGFKSDTFLIWFPVLNFVILPFLCFVCIASSFNFFQSGETKFSFFLLFWGFVPMRCQCSCVFRTFFSERAGQGQFQCFGVNTLHCLLEQSQSLALSQFPRPRLAPNTHLPEQRFGTHT